jgi:hypothetical protein
MRKHTKRKHWATGHLLLGSQRDKMVLPAHMALDAIEMGAGDISHRHTLAAFLNVCATLAGRMPGTAPETRDALAAAADALVNTDRRFLRLKKWGLSAEDMRALRRAVVLGDALMGRANTATLQFAVNFVWDQNERVPETLGTAQEPLALPDQVAA